MKRDDQLKLTKVHSSLSTIDGGTVPEIMDQALQ